MTGTAGIFPEFMTGIWKSFNNGNYNLAKNLQFAILPLIREMKSVNFPQGFKEAMSLRGIDMGRPMMNYPNETLAKIADLKERLKIEMTSLLYEYFPGMPLTYKAHEETNIKYDYPAVQADAGKKKFDDCTQCGMCDGTVREGADNAVKLSDISSPKDIESSLSSEDIESIIAETVKRIKGDN